MKTITLISLFSIILFSCAANKPTDSNNLTLGAVQSKIHKGQSQSKVLEILGSPNIVTNDDGREVWTYDRISRENNASSNSFFYFLNPIYWFFGGGVSSGSSASESSKSLTVIITFDDNKNVLDFTYQSLKY
jgi:outer membrane protein assembly factor BamE (lipoprotein component of BamABCDE complex)|tara:strand:- start:663 stop:1058 length:396 start_codon:yes stop_codon:yes gene_type:complete